MEMSPHQVRTATFGSSRKGFDPSEVSSFLQRVAEALETAQNHSTAMEARARAAISRLQEATANAEATPASEIEPDQAETISRTLLLAQRTADLTVAESRAEADKILEAARTEAAATLDSTREMSSRLLEDARAEARALESEERSRARDEVDALIARREFVLADVEHLEQFLAGQRDRLREAAASLLDLTERVDGGIGPATAPLLSAVSATRFDESPSDQPPVVEFPADEPLVVEIPADEQPADDEPVDEYGDDAAASPLEEEPFAIVLSNDDPTPTDDLNRLRFGPPEPGRSDSATGSL
jgi:DivIVA domain-containing protein